MDKTCLKSASLLGLSCDACHSVIAQFLVPNIIVKHPLSLGSSHYLVYILKSNYYKRCLNFLTYEQLTLKAFMVRPKSATGKCWYFEHWLTSVSPGYNPADIIRKRRRQQQSYMNSISTTHIPWGQNHTVTTHSGHTLRAESLYVLETGWGIVCWDNWASLGPLSKIQRKCKCDCVCVSVCVYVY